MDRHGAYVGMTRHREGMARHYGRDDFKGDARLVRTLSRERTKDMASDSRQVDPVKEYAERRGISFGARVMEMARAGAGEARGIGWEHRSDGKACVSQCRSRPATAP